jgi:hypothetical protein
MGRHQRMGGMRRGGGGVRLPALGRERAGELLRFDDAEEGGASVDGAEGRAAGTWKPPGLRKMWDTRMGCATNVVSTITRRK